MRVEVIYALPGEASVVSLTLDGHPTLRQAVERSGLLRRHPEIRLETDGAGIHGRLCPLDTPLADGDRVEIYRPLQADPKALRKAGRLGRREG